MKWKKVACVEHVSQIEFAASYAWLKRKNETLFYLYLEKAHS